MEALVSGASSDMTLGTPCLTQEAELLAMLRQGSKTTADFCKTALAREYPRVIHRLRHLKGYDIRSERMTRTCWRFTLVSEPQANGNRVFSFA